MSFVFCIVLEIQVVPFGPLALKLQYVTLKSINQQPAEAKAKVIATPFCRRGTDFFNIGSKPQLFRKVLLYQYMSSVHLNIEHVSVSVYKGSLFSVHIHTFLIINSSRGQNVYNGPYTISYYMYVCKGAFHNMYICIILNTHNERDQLNNNHSKTTRVYNFSMYEQYVAIQII